VTFEREVAEVNARRTSVLLPILLVAHAVHVAVFHRSGAARAAMTPVALHWRDGIALTHAVTFVLVLPLAIVALRGRKGGAPQWLGAAVSLVYLLHAAIVVGIDQQEVTSVTPFIGYALGVAVVIVLPPRVSIPLYVVGLAAFVVSIETMQAAANARLAILPNGFSIVVLSVAFSWILWSARKRDFSQRETIESQRAALAQLNESLERRLEEKVAEIVERAEEVERLNAHLQAQVRARSTELEAALAKLGESRPSAANLAPGAVVADRFEIARVLGEGGMGVVYEGVDRVSHERVAIKVVHASSARELEALQRFVREAGSVAAVRHPAIVRMLHVDVTAEGMLYQVQELVPGETLAKARGNRAWPAAQAARLGAVLAEALAAAHAASIIHRDVKPGNVLLTASAPGLKLVDFGIAKLKEDSATTPSGTRSGMMLGTPAFMAPEQIDGARDVTDRADVYAAGVTLFLLVTGRYPFEGASSVHVMISHKLVDAPDPRELAPGLPADFAALLRACLAKEPAARPSAAELARALGAIADALGAPSLEQIALRRKSERVAEDVIPTVAES
jgi:serine/threonine-protein kinase